jgi:hypothetical protein
MRFHAEWKLLARPQTARFMQSEHFQTKTSLGSSVSEWKRASPTP